MYDYKSLLTIVYICLLDLGTMFLILFMAYLWVGNLLVNPDEFCVWAGHFWCIQAALFASEWKLRALQLILAQPGCFSMHIQLAYWCSQVVNNSSAVPINWPNEHWKTARLFPHSFHSAHSFHSDGNRARSDASKVTSSDTEFIRIRQ